MATNDENAPRRAGQQPDELLPGETTDKDPAGGINAAGTPGGGLASGGLAGTNAGGGGYEDVNQEDAMNSGIFDHSGDTVDSVDEGTPEAGRSGGAAGGTPAGKRSGPRPHDDN